ncbi:alpha/beta hydrolase [Erythrobacter sp. KY5]|uniref:alpha/beta hydrolase n=1 Tax=Erythrobacter sp. KY5 TaxID=2011159 RepID=UPI0013A709EF|nr:alpha/beta fold hydrolase [Erythrobacter sp. KY5]
MHAQTQIEALVMEASDGDRITGFLFQKHGTGDDAPVAILMHGLGQSSLAWLAYDQAFYVDVVTRDLIDRGYRVFALDARAHGPRADHISPMDRLQGARSGDAGPYRAMINLTVADYVELLDYIDKRFGRPERLLAIGYSMGAQTAILLSAQDDRVSHIATMVPPAVRNVPDVAPITFADHVKSKWLLVTAGKDQFSTPEQNTELVALAGANLTRVEFDSGHRLPREYTHVVSEWIAQEDRANSTIGAGER